MKRECEMVNGTWFEYFHKVDEPVFDDRVCRKAEKLMKDCYGSFFERNLTKEGGSLLSLGAGYGLREIPLARRGYKIIGIDNDLQALDLLRDNARKYGEGNLTARFGDLYKNFHEEFIDQNIQACISFGVLEHFTRQDLEELIKKQFMISPLIIAMVPIATPETLKSFKAQENPEGHIDENGIYRNFWTSKFWEEEIFKDYQILEKRFSTNHASFGQVDMVTFVVRTNLER